LLAESADSGSPTSLPPMAAGVFGYLGYDMVREMERLPAAARPPRLARRHA
jgi:anthranilate synthase component 1